MGMSFARWAWSRLHSLPTLRYVVSTHGWYLAPVGAKCWESFHLRFVNPVYISYPFPEETVSILSGTSSQVVIQALAPEEHLRELDYIDAKSLLTPKTVDFVTTMGKTYRYTYTSLRAHAPPPLATPTCAGNGAS